MASGTMVQLAASVGQIDTSDNLTMVPAFGKVIILNGSNKKVFDPSNTKIATDDLGANPPDHGTVLTGGTSGAKMVVDYITTLASACTIYGLKVDTTKTFSNGETVTGLDDDSNAISFVLNAAETAPKHWYSFTKYGNSSSYGSVPTKLYLGAMHLGRLYLAGNPEDPHQWYASRQGNIHDFLYDSTDVQGACTGGDVEFGEIQDSIRSLIPWTHDYLLYGCQSSIYVLMGDPMQGGSMKTIAEGTGVYGFKSWCTDEQNTLYFFGTGGIYRIAQGSFGVESLTEIPLPRLIHDESVDPSTHRVTLEYDYRRHGISVAITKLSDNTNSCYWYERRTGAWLPEELPEECAPYSMLYYHSSTVTQRDLLIGCADGYIRCPVDTEKSDDVGNTDEAIDSYVTLGPFKLGEREGEDGLIGNIVGILAGGASGGSELDSNNVTYYTYVGDSPEQVMEKVYANTYSATGTVYAPGLQRGRKQIRTVRGKYAAIRLRNNTAAQTWGFEELDVEVTPVGRLL